MKISNWDIKDENFGPFLPYVKNENITDINYNGQDVWVEDLIKGRYKATTIDEETGKEIPLTLTQEFINQFATRMGNLVNEQFNPFNNVLEAETDTLRVSIIHESVSPTGTSISIRKTPAVRRLTEEKILKENYCSVNVLKFLKNCVHGKMNMVFCGLTGAGKTELLKFLTQYIPPEEKVITIEDNCEIHYRDLNPGSNVVELKINDDNFTYTKAIKTALRQYPQWIILSEARSEEVKYLLEAFSTGHHGLTTLHTDDCRKIPDRIENMMQDSYAASRLKNDIYTFLDIGVLIRRKVNGDGSIRRYIDQICIYDREDEENSIKLIVEDGKIISKDLPKNIIKKFGLEDITDPFI